MSNAHGRHQQEYPGRGLLPAGGPQAHRSRLAYRVRHPTGWSLPIDGLRGDAVIVGYRPDSVCPEEDFPPLCRGTIQPSGR